MSAYEQWKKRKQGFDSHVEAVTLGRKVDDAKKIGQEKPNDPTENLINLAVFLSAFTNNLFSFFLNGFSDFLGEKVKKGIKLIPSAEYPPEYVLQKILQQASFDLTVIQRAIEQRKEPKSDLAVFLETCDDLALSALAIAFPDPQKKETWLIDPVKPFVYFQRETSVRIIPYANALLIGIPYSAFEQPIDLLSIPHEVGHHVYQTGWFSANEPISLFFSKYFADQDEWIQNWLEEIFADLFGFLVAGPISAYGLQEILLDNLPGNLTDDDGEHPAGIIRPLTFSPLFLSHRFNGGPGAQETEAALRTRWKNEGKRRGLSNKFKTTTESNAIDGEKASKTLGEVLRSMNEQINDKTQGAFNFPASLNSTLNLKPWTLFPSTEAAASKDGLSKLDNYAPFAEFDGAAIVSSPSGKAQLDKMAEVYRISEFELSRQKQNAFWLTGQIDYWDGRVVSKDYPPLPPLMPNIWKLIFTAFSWADKPADDTRPGHGPEKISPEYIHW